MRILSLWPELILDSRARWSALFLCAMFVLSFVATPAEGITKSSQGKRSRKSSTRTFRSYRLVRWNPVFAGSHDLLVKQNIELDRQQLPRINDEIELMQYELSQDLVPVSESDSLKIAGDLPDNRRYCRPWTRDFLEDFSQAFYNEFGVPIQVNSLVRTAQQQRKLRRHNRFAAPDVGDTASTHLAGVSADLSRRGISKAQYQWIRDYLMPLHEAGLVEPIEERQPVLHVVVYQKYSAHEPDTLTVSPNALTASQAVSEPAVPQVDHSPAPPLPSMSFAGSSFGSQR